MRIYLLLLGMTALSASPARATDARVCVTNSSDRAHVFVAEAAGAGRNLSWLQPGEVLCTDPVAPGARGVVSVFEAEDALEGCSRLVAPGQAEALIRYVDFDRCEWVSNSQDTRQN